MARHLHKSFSDQQVKALLGRYVGQEIKLEHILGVLKIGRSRFFEILKDYRADPGGFTVPIRGRAVPASSPRRSKGTSSGNCDSRNS